MIYSTIMKAYKQVCQHEWEEGLNQFFCTERSIYGEKKRKSTAALCQTERGIDIQPLCNLYSDNDYDNGDGNSDMHDDHD